MQLCNYATGDRHYFRAYMQLGTGTFFKIHLDFLLYFCIFTAANMNFSEKGACPQLHCPQLHSRKKGACPQLHLRCLIEYNEGKFR